MILLQICNIKIMFQVKVAILKYIETLTLQMEPQDFVNSSETRLAVSRIITWTTEPKSSDVRKVQDIVCLLHEWYFKCFSSLFLDLLWWSWLVDEGLIMCFDYRRRSRCWSRCSSWTHQSSQCFLLHYLKPFRMEPLNCCRTTYGTQATQPRWFTLNL